MTLTEAIVGRKLSTRGTHTVLTTNTGKTIVVAGTVPETSNLVSFLWHKKGDTFVALKNSSRNFTEGENKGNPLYVEGDTVTRTQDSFEAVGYSHNAAIDALIAQQILQGAK